MFTHQGPRHIHHLDGAHTPMFDENKHTHPQNNDEGPRHIHRGIKREPDEKWR